MRVSRLMLVTLRDDPAEAEIPSHRLLLRGGYIRRVASGVYAYLPLLWRVLQKIQAIVREEINAAGGLETLLPQLQPAELWERSGRWQGYTAGEGIMFHLIDRQDRSMGLGPTHEEVVTALAAELLRSYRQLPVCLYQIQTKFRDEIRPRFGLMRGREFIMKDAYSFHADEADLRATYAVMDDAYRRIFRRCGLKTVAVEADSGAIGGSASQEFMVTAEAGEDLVLSSPDGTYAANQERAVSQAEPAVPLEIASEPVLLETPGQSTVESLCEVHGLDPSQVVKVLLFRACFADATVQPLLVCLRGDQHLNDVKLANAVGSHFREAGGLLEITPLELPSIPYGYIGPDLPDHVLGPGAAFLRLADATALELRGFVCGANVPDAHRIGASWQSLGVRLEPHDLRAAQPGERCVHDPAQRLIASRGIEVGHIFQLGRRYSDALQARFTNDRGEEEALWMGCYGIGVSRLAQAAVEQHHDAKGIRWPVPIAPFEVIVVIANVQDPVQVDLAERIFGELRAMGIETLLDDRPERAGVKFKDAELIGIPWRVVVGRAAASGRVEVAARSGEAGEEVAAAALGSWLLERLQQQRRGILPGGST